MAYNLPLRKLQNVLIISTSFSFKRAKFHFLLDHIRIETSDSTYTLSIISSYNYHGNGPIPASFQLSYSLSIGLPGCVVRFRIIVCLFIFLNVRGGILLGNLYTFIQFDL